MKQPACVSSACAVKPLCDDKCPHFHNYHPERRAEGLPWCSPPVFPVPELSCERVVIAVFQLKHGGIAIPHRASALFLPSMITHHLEGQPYCLY